MMQLSPSVDRPALADICQNLDSHDVAALKYLVQDRVDRAELDGSKVALDIFSLLEQDTRNIPILKRIISQCLILINQICLVRHLGLNPEDVKREEEDDIMTISPYRKALFKIAQDLSVQDVEKIINFLHVNSLLSNFTPTVRKLEKVKPTERAFVLFDTLEERKDITAANSRILKRLLSEINRSDLHSLIEPFTGPEGMEEYYRMNSGNRGKCLIISNLNFLDNILPRRDGTQKDVAALKDTFEKLRFIPVVHTDLTAKQMHDVIDNLSKEDHSEACASVVCILSHGAKGVVVGTDGEPIYLRNITVKFTASNCKSLAEKPKLFIIQACQGKKEQLLPRTRNKNHNSTAGRSDVNASMLEPIIGDEDYDALHIPDGSDFLLGYSTVPDYVSYRNDIGGCWYIQALCQQIQNKCSSHHMLEIMTDVNNQLGKQNIPVKDGKMAKTTAAKYSTLTAKLHFFPENIRSQ